MNIFIKILRQDVFFYFLSIFALTKFHFNDSFKNTWDEETIRVPGEIVIGFRFGLLRAKII